MSMYDCPECGLRVDGIQRELAVVDLLCPRCGGALLSEFREVPEPTTNWHNRAMAAEIREKAALSKVDHYREHKDDAYGERNKVVAALARLFPSGLKVTDIPGWDEEWHNCIYIDLPSGQVSWHYHDSQAHLFEGLPAYDGEWDGHDTEEKYRRLAALKDPGRPLPKHGSGP